MFEIFQLIKMTYEVLNLFTIYLFNSEQLSIVVEASRLKVTIDADAFFHCFTNEVCVNTPGPGLKS